MDIDLLSLPYEDMVALVTDMGYPAFRAKQLRGWVAKGTPIEDMSNLPRDFRDKLIEQVNHIVVRDPERWKTEYVPLPSRYIESQDSFLLAGNEDLIRAECRHILETQEPDGSYPVPWQWWNDYKEYTLSANWWKADFVIRNMRFLKEFGNI